MKSHSQRCGLSFAELIWVLPISTLVIVLFGINSAMGQNVGYFQKSTYKIEQLTGDRDTTRDILTASRTKTNGGINKTDLGSTFEHQGRLYFLFGDTPYVGAEDQAGNDDFIASTNSLNPWDVTLGQYLKISVPGVSLDVFEIPSGGISVDNVIYMVATTDYNVANPNAVMGRSVLAKSMDNGASFQKVYDLSTEAFINVSMVEVNGSDYPGILPPERCVLIWGSGPYRTSDVKLAYIPSARIEDRNALRYCPIAGSPPLWVTAEHLAAPLFNQQPQPAVGELSVAWCAQLNRWIMLYNNPAGIVLRSSLKPWGPWSPETTIFDSFGNTAMGHYMHWKDHDTLIDDGPPRLNAANEGGAPYGPYLIPRYFQGGGNRVTIVYSMSTWNPYQVVLMQSDIGFPDAVPEVLHETTVLPGGPGWITSHPNFLQSFSKDNQPHVTTYGPNGDADMGVAQHGFLAGGGDDALEFRVHGGEARVVMIEQTQAVPDSPVNIQAFYSALMAGSFGKVVESVKGPRSNGHEVLVRWNLRRHRGKAMRIFIIDASSDPWGFISVSQFTRSCVTGSPPTIAYVDSARTNSPPHLGTAANPFPTVNGAYNAATDCGCGGRLRIQAGSYPEALMLAKPVILEAVAGPNGEPVHIGN